MLRKDYKNRSLNLYKKWDFLKILDSINLNIFLNYSLWFYNYNFVNLILYYEDLTSVLFSPIYKVVLGFILILLYFLIYSISLLNYIVSEVDKAILIYDITLSWYLLNLSISNLFYDSLWFLTLFVYS